MGAVAASNSSMCEQVAQIFSCSQLRPQTVTAGDVEAAAATAVCSRDSVPAENDGGFSVHCKYLVPSTSGKLLTVFYGSHIFNNVDINAAIAAAAATAHRGTVQC